MTTRTITIPLEDIEGWDGDYWVVRHAVAVATDHHRQALKGIARRKGKTRATSSAIDRHNDALAKLEAARARFVAAHKATVGGQETDPVRIAARALLHRLYTMTSDEFLHGGERAEREALQSALGLSDEDVFEART